MWGRVADWLQLIHDGAKRQLLENSNFFKQTKFYNFFETFLLTKSCGNLINYFLLTSLTLSLFTCVSLIHTFAICHDV